MMVEVLRRLVLMPHHTLLRSPVAAAVLPLRRIERELAEKRQREQVHLAKQKELQEQQIAAAKHRAEQAEVGGVFVGKRQLTGA